MCKAINTLYNKIHNIIMTSIETRELENQLSTAHYYLSGMHVS